MSAVIDLDRFKRVQADIYEQVLDAFFGGASDPVTLLKLKSEIDG